ncbi:MAG TPA: histidine kinase, partial [Pseudogracilibacillus sp.]|nr:histidine kinase [Pseudogracilibacillus sp.]
MGFILILVLMVVVILIITLLQKFKLKLLPHVSLIMVIFSIPLISVLLLSAAVVSEIHVVNNPNYIFICLAAFTVYMNLCILYLYVTLRNYY